MPAPPLPGSDDKVSQPVPFPGGFVMAEGKGPLLAVADGRNSLGINAPRYQVIPDRLGPVFAEPQVVLVGPPLIAVALDCDPSGRIGLEPLDVVAQGLLRLIGQDGLVEIEEDV